MVLNGNYQLVAETYYGSISGYDQLTLQLYAKLDSQSIANNKSTVTLLARMKNTGYYAYSYQCYCNLNDKMVQDNTYIYFTGNATIDLGTNQIEIDHNPNGTATGISKWVKFSSSGMSEKTASGSFDLPTIPRYATCQQSLASKTETSITMNWSSDNTIDRVWYSKDGGTTWTLVGDVNATSGSYTISGLTANTTYSIKTRVRRKDSQLTTDSTATSVKTYANVTQSFSSKTVNSITMSWTLDTEADKIWYSIGSGWVEIWNGNAKTGTYTITGLTPNTDYNVYVRARRKSTQTLSDTLSSPVKVKTYKIPKITSSPDMLVIGNNATIQFDDNESRATISACVCNTAGQIIYAPYRSIGNASSGNYTFQFTTEEINNLYNAIPNDPKGNLMYVIRITVNGTNYYSTSIKEMKVNESICKPIFSDFYYEDEDANVTALTRNNKILVNGLSNPTIVVWEANKAVAKNGASMSRYRVKAGNKTFEKAYSATGNEYLGKITDITSPIIEVSAIDSRGIETKVTKTATWKDYKNISITKMELKRENAIGTKVFFDFEADYWNGNFGATQNVIDNVQFRYMPKGGSYSSWVDITNSIQYANGKVTTIDGSFLPTTNNGSTPIEFVVGTVYYVQFHIDDKTLNIQSTNSQAQYIDDGKPCTDKYKDSNGDYHIGINQLAEADNVLAIGGSTNINTNSNEAYTGYKQDNIMLIRKDGTNVIVSGASGKIYIRPNGTASQTGQIEISNDGSIKINGTLKVANYYGVDMGFTPVLRGDRGDDLNNVSTTITHYCNSALNMPSSRNGFCSTIAYESGYIRQTFYDYGNRDLIYTRAKVNGTWNGWKVMPTMANLGTIIKTMATTITIPVSSAGGKGYVSKSITIPDGYKFLFATFGTGQISANSGLQLTTLYPYATAYGSQTLYVEYYNPVAITSATVIDTKIIMVQSDFIDN